MDLWLLGGEADVLDPTPSPTISTTGPSYITPEFFLMMISYDSNFELKEGSLSLFVFTMGCVDRGDKKGCHQVKLGNKN